MRKRFKIITIILVILLALLFLCLLASLVVITILIKTDLNPTSFLLEPSFTPSSSPSPLVTESVTDDLLGKNDLFDKKAMAYLVVYHGFDEPSEFVGMWKIFEDEDIQTKEMFSAYYVTISEGADASFINYSGNVFSDTISEITISDYSSFDDSVYALTCRYYNKDNYYVMGLSGGYPFIAAYIDRKFVLLHSSLPLPDKIKGQGDSLKLSAVCDGKNLDLFINDKNVYSATDTSFTIGDNGVVISASRPGVKVFAAIENYSLYKIR